MVLAWIREKECWLVVAAMKMPVDQMGRTLRRDFGSSTCLTVHKLHGFDASPSGVNSFSWFLIMQALFRNLKYGQTLCIISEP